MPNKDQQWYAILEAMARYMTCECEHNEWASRCIYGFKEESQVIWC